MRGFRIVACLAFFGLFGQVAMAESGQPHWPADAKVFFIEPKDGDVIEGPVKVVMGAKNIEIAPAGTGKPATGHHHILIDTDVPTGEKLQAPLPADDTIKHFGKGQTEATLALPPGKHTLQLVLGDGNHIPYDRPLVSEKIRVTVK